MILAIAVRALAVLFVLSAAANLMLLMDRFELAAELEQVRGYLRGKCIQVSDTA